MKTQTVKSYFKKIADSSSNPRAGQKREDLSWSFEALEVQDLDSLPKENVVQVLNSFTEAFGRKLIAQASDDWSFVPSGVSFQSAFEDLIAERTSSRLVTKESLKALGEFYKVNAVKYMSVSLAAAQAGSGVIQDRFKAIAGKNDALGVMSSRLLSLVEAVPEEEVLPFVELIEALVNELNGLMEVKITADLL